MSRPVKTPDSFKTSSAVAYDILRRTSASSPARSDSIIPHLLLTVSDE